MLGEGVAGWGGGEGEGYRKVFWVEIRRQLGQWEGDPFKEKAKRLIDLDH